MIWLLLLLLLSCTLTSGKVYDRCELARELKYVHRAPDHQLATWVCIAEHESQYNTSAVGHVNGDESGDHGLFQVNDRYWCSPPGKGLGCGLPCSQFEDDDIGDDFLCSQLIYSEHKLLSGDGFNAWAVYKPHCKGSKADKYVKGCFKASEEPKSFAVDISTSLPSGFAHGFFDTAAGKSSKDFSTSFEGLTFDFVSTPRTTIPSFIRPTTSNPVFYTPSTSRVSTFVPVTSKSDFFNPSTITTRRPIIFNPTTSRTQSIVSIPTRSSVFDSSRSFFQTPSTRSSFFTSTTSKTVYQNNGGNDLAKKPVFIFNGVKWY